MINLQNIIKNYNINTFYSEEDESFIAVAPDLPGCSAFGNTKEEAIKEIKIAMKLWLNISLEDKEELPAISE